MNATPESLIKEYADPIEQQEIEQADSPIYQGYVGNQTSYA